MQQRRSQRIWLRMKSEMTGRLTIQHGGNRAFYSPGRDIVQMPELKTFRDAESYYATLAHEMTTGTRHESRLNRDLGRKRFADAGYAMEELVAEIGAAFLCADLGITPETRDDHAAYIASWLKVLKNDKRAIFTAASHAQKAADFLHAMQPQASNAQPRICGRPHRADWGRGHALALASCSSGRPFLARPG